MSEKLPTIDRGDGPESCGACLCSVVRMGKLWCRFMPPGSDVVALREAQDKITIRGPVASYNLQSVPSRPEVGPDDWCYQWKAKLK